MNTLICSLCDSWANKTNPNKLVRSKYSVLLQRSRGFGFITFCAPTSLDKVLAVSSHLLDGKKIDPKPATPKAKSKEAKTRKIFVGGVSQDTSAEEVKKYFSQYGQLRQ